MYHFAYISLLIVERSSQARTYFCQEKFFTCLTLPAVQFLVLPPRYWTCAVYHLNTSTRTLHCCFLTSLVTTQHEKKERAVTTQKSSGIFKLTCQWSCFSYSLHQVILEHKHCMIRCWMESFSTLNNLKHQNFHEPKKFYCLYVYVFKEHYFNTGLPKYVQYQNDQA